MGSAGGRGAAPEGGGGPRHLLRHGQAPAAETASETPPSKPADRFIRYEFVREAGGWKIDEIKGAVDGEAWSLRAIITDFLKY